MRGVCSTALLCVLLPSAAFAAPCLPGSLAAYVALGSTACSVGPVVFASFASLPLQGGAIAIPDASTFVNPVNVADRPGLRFDVDSRADAGTFLQRVIGYSVAGASMTGNQVALTGSAVAPDGAVTAIEHTCRGAAFGPLQSCSGLATSLTAYDLGPLGQSLLETSTFPPTGLLGVVLDIAVDGGPGGTASLRSVTTQFTAVPEPGTLTLLTMGVAAGLHGRRRRARAGVAGRRPGW